MSTELETRLAEALTARADRVGPADLRPAFAPHPVDPRWSRVRPAYLGGGALVAAAAAAVVVVAVLGNNDGEARPVTPAASTTATDAPPQETVAPTPAPTSTPEPIAALPDGLLPEDAPTFSSNGETVTYDDGTSATVTGEEIAVTVDGVTSTVALPAPAEGGVSATPLRLGGAGQGYLVSQSAGEFNGWSVVLVREGQAVVATAPVDVPFGNAYSEQTGAIFESWTTGSGSALYTRVALEDPDAPESSYQLYRWEVDAAAATLDPTDLGVVCMDLAADTYSRCDEGGSTSTGLLPEDTVRETRPGEAYTYPDESRADLIPSGGGFDLSVTRDGVTRRIAVPRVSDPAVDQQQVTVADAVGYLVRDESGDSTSLRLFLLRAGTLTEATVRGGDVRFGGGFTEDGTSFRTYLAGGGRAIYTEVRASLQDDEADVYEWNIDPVSGDLEPVLIRSTSS